jgi:hypothetical protein
MSSSSHEPVDLLDLKLLPAWVKEPSETRSYAHYEGEPQEERPRERDRRTRERGGRREKRPTPLRAVGSTKPEANVQPASAVDGLRRGERPTSNAERANRPREQLTRKGRVYHPSQRKDRQPQDRQKPFERPAPEISVRFLPHPPALENVIGQIKSNAVAYSVFSLARLFLEKPERYDVHLTPKPNCSLHRLGENGTLSADRQFLENNAFRFAQEDFYKVDVTQSDPIKGSFSSVARCRLSGLLLGPTNHHGYQPKLRNLYEQRFSRRMSFPEYQRQIEIVSDPAVVEQWKEEARNVTTFTTLREESPTTFGSATEAERHFRQNYMPGLVRNAEESTIDGVTSRQMPDRILRRLIEDAWSRETRSPSQMMQELAKSFRDAGLQIFRHRRGMLFISPIRARPFAHDQTSVSLQVRAILETLTANPRTNRKELAEKLLPNLAIDDAESRKLALASDLHWLISEGCVIEFNDGSLDLPRVKVKPTEESRDETVKQANKSESEDVGAAVPTAEPANPVLAAASTATTFAEVPQGSAGSSEASDAIARL